MKIIELDCYEIYSTDGYTDTTEGYVSSEKVAQDVIMQLGDKGYNRFREFTREFIIHDSVSSYMGEKNENRRAAILSKLTKSEQEFLGLK